MESHNAKRCVCLTQCVRGTCQVLECTNGAGVDVVIEMLANVNLEYDLQLLAPGGRVAVVGNRGTVVGRASPLPHVYLCDTWCAMV